MTDIKNKYFSYGIKKGTRSYTGKEIQMLCLDKDKQKKFTFVESKSQFYKLMFDFDFKINIIGSFINESEKIVKYINDTIIRVLNEIIIDPNIEYIYAIKNIGFGVHIYYPNLIVNKQLHFQIYKLALNILEKDDHFPINIIKNIFDNHVCKTNGLRLFYCYNKENYYYPLQSLSTYKFNPDPNEHFKLCLINTDKNNYNFILKSDFANLNKPNNIKTKNNGILSKSNLAQYYFSHNLNNYQNCYTCDNCCSGN